jgi:GT2 family glycosyltransferase
MSVGRQRTVTAVIVSYKSAALTLACLRSLLAERDAPGISLRCVVVDNASGDAPAIESAIKRERWDDWITLIEAPRNGGFAYGNNLGFARACQDGAVDYLHMLNPDTEVKKGAVGTLVEFLEAHPQVGIAGSSFENADGSDWPIAFRFPSLLSELESGLQLGLVSRVLRRWNVVRIMTPQVQPVDWGAGASMMVRRSLIDRIGGLDENYFLYFEETEFCWRAKQAGFPMWYVPQSRVVHIGGQSTKVTERNAAPKRLPGYWFESRRRYFVTTSGLLPAALIDCTAIVASALGSLRLHLQGRRDRIVPHYVIDLWRHSVCRRKNRDVAIARTRLPCSFG